ncbi:MAG: acyl-CoA dehydrogenase family protein [Pseudomonadota bacterium]
MDILNNARSHCDSVIKPNIHTWNKQAKWPRAASDKAGKVGLTGLYCPEDFGGQGLSLAQGIPVYEELGKGDGAYAFTLSMHNICTYAVCSYAGDSFKQEWARALTSGSKLANFSLTEPQSGSDAGNLQTSAEILPNGDYKINGAKAWVSLAGEADIYLVVTKTPEAPGHKGAAMIAIPKDIKGLSFGPLYQTPSYQFLPMSQMYLKDVVVSKDNIILPPGKGLPGALMAIDIARTSIASGCCGLIETALNTALDYAHERKMFKGRQLDLDGIRWMLGDVANDLEISRLLYHKAAGLLGTPEGTIAAAHAKLFVPDAALRAANICTQVLGGAGLWAEYDMDRLSRLAQMLKIVDGTTEIQRVVLGRMLARQAVERSA